jgi:hypothetical protein
MPQQPPQRSSPTIAAYSRLSVPIRQFLPDGERILGPVQTELADPEMLIYRHFVEGWTTGFEPATAWTTTRSSTS